MENSLTVRQLIDLLSALPENQKDWPVTFGISDVEEPIVRVDVIETLEESWISLSPYYKGDGGPPYDAATATGMYDRY